MVLPWDDPNRDIGADMVATFTGWLLEYVPGMGLEEATQHVAKFLRASSFRITDTSVQAAADELSRPRRNEQPATASPAGGTGWSRADGTSGAPPSRRSPDQPARWPIDLTRRVPAYNWLSAEDITLNHERIGAEYERLSGRAGFLPVSRRRTTDINDLIHQSRPKQGGKRSEQRQALADEVLRLWLDDSGTHTVITTTGDGYTVIDETHLFRDGHQAAPNWLNLEDFRGEHDGELPAAALRLYLNDRRTVPGRPIWYESRPVQQP